MPKAALAVAALAFFIVFVSPQTAHAFGITALLKKLFFGVPRAVSNFEFDAHASAKDLPFLEPVKNADLYAGRGGAALQIVGDNALVPTVGPLGSMADVRDVPMQYQITTYKVREGDNLSTIAQSFGVSVATIYWANDLKRTDLVRTGDTLIIFPISGVEHVVKKGETVSSIAAKYKADRTEIMSYNGLATEGELKTGQEIMIPDGDMPLPKVQKGVKRVVRGGGPSIPGYYGRPIIGGRKSQGLHGYNGIDLATPCGNPLFASASGLVIIARGSGWNGGYGKYVVIRHPNNTQTLYAHMSSVSVFKGQYVSKGRVIGAVGSTGRSTGCHVHFEVRGARNPY